MGTVRIKDHWAEQRLFESRALAAAFIIAALTVVLVGRLVVLQVMRFDYYAELSQGNRVRVEPLPAQRGLILDRNGQVLAENRPAFQLELVRERVPDVDATLKRLIEIGVLPVDDLDETRKLVKSRRSFESVPIRLRLTDEEIARFAVHRFEFPGVDIATRLTRFYPHGEHAVHALGYVAAISEGDVKRLEKEKQLTKYAGTSLIGKLGIEASYEKELHGTDGSRQILVNAAGRSVQRAPTCRRSIPTPAFSATGGPRSEDVNPVAGVDVMTSIDLPTQLVAEQGLIGRRGAVVAIDPSNGDVIAMVSTPGFDPNPFGRGLTKAEYGALRDNIDVPLLNRAIRGEYPPGSTVKPMIALGGLSYGVITPQRTRVCSGFFTLPGSSHRSAMRQRSRSVSMETAIAKSCDVYFYDLANQLGVEQASPACSRISDSASPPASTSPASAGHPALARMEEGALQEPGRPGVVPRRNRDFRHRPGLPRRDAAAGCAHGIHPRLARQELSAAPGQSLSEEGTGKIKPVTPKLLESIDVASAENWQVAVNGMIKVMNAGTGGAARPARNTRSPARPAPRRCSRSRRTRATRSWRRTLNDRLLDHGWFIAFAPADNPKIAVAVLIENGKHGTAAAPIARRVLDQFILGHTTTPDIPPPVVTPSGEVVPPAAPGDE